jgi:radical SAM protein with 4Fe4S-binding SPASM domain
MHWKNQKNLPQRIVTMPPSTILHTTLPELFKKRDIENKHIPIAFDFDITARCNNDCNHCYINVPADDTDYQQRELSLKQLEEIVDQAVSMGTLWCLLSGGEPLLREDFEEIYLMLKRKGLLVSLYTNATLVNDDHIELFKKYPPRDIEVTVYGVTQDTFGKVTNRPGNFEPFMRGLNRLLDNQIPVRLKTMVMRSNIHEFSEIAAFCRKYTNDIFRYDPHLHLRYDRDPVRNRRILSERLTPEEIAALDHKDPARSESLKKDCHIYISDSIKSGDHRQLFTCGLGRESFSLSFDGQFRLCPTLCAPGFTYDLKKGSLAEAWTTFTPRILSMPASNPEIRKKCLKCSIFNLCQWCPANAYLEYGQLEYLPDYFCKVAHSRQAALELRLKSDPK